MGQYTHLKFEEQKYENKNFLKSGISVIIPCYNTEKYLKQCLDSVINQTFKDIEIICVNDGSTDTTLQILEEYAQKDSRIKIVTQENKGLSGARNTGLEYVTSKYCYFLDSDDYIEPNLLDTAINILNNNQVDYYCFGSKVFIEDEKDLVQDTESMNEYLRIKFNGVKTAIFDVGQNQNIHVWNKIFRTQIIKENNIHFIEGLLYEDIFFTWYYFFLSKKIYFDKNIYHHYRMHSNSIMEKTTLNKSFDSAVSHLYNWYELFQTISQNKKLFSKNYRNLLILLRNYKRRTIEMSPSVDKGKICQLTKDYKNELDKLYINEFGLFKFLTNSQKLFYFQLGCRKSTLCFFGIKLKINHEKLHLKKEGIIE